MKKTVIVLTTLFLSLCTFATITLAKTDIESDDINKNEKTVTQKEEEISDLAFEIGSSVNNMMIWNNFSVDLFFASHDMLNQSDVNNKTKEKEANPEQPVKEKKKITVTATAYTAYCDGCSGVTYTGIDLIENPNQKVIAVDPNVIPLGTKVYVEGYGTAIAGDIGSAIKGHRIDVFIPSEDKAFKWGVKEVDVTILG